MRFLIIIAALSIIPLEAYSHRSGCHRWHSCPSDRGTYVCGDTGYCNYCPDNKYCKDGKPKSKGDMKKEDIKEEEQSNEHY